MPKLTVYKPLLSGVFAKLRKATSSFVMSVCPSVCPQWTVRFTMGEYIYIYIFFFFFGRDSPPVGQGLLILKVSTSHTNDAPQSAGLLWTSDQLVAETSTWQHATLKTDKHPCPPVWFEPTISAGERPQTYALDRAATGTGGRIYTTFYILGFLENLSEKFQFH